MALRARGGRSTTEAMNDFLGTHPCRSGSVHFETFAPSCARVLWVPGEADENITIAATAKNRIDWVSGESRSTNLAILYLRRSVGCHMAYAIS